MRDMKRIEIKVDETKQLERIKKSLQRLKEETKEETKECGHAVCGCAEGLEHTPAEKKFLNKLTVGVYAVAVLIVFAAYVLLPEIK